ncbi:MAG TPA: methyl-accepting chemotaxis protein [Xanthobacteraceae bacterium]|nr:methyl-accepting chemotaxis protein [Xanthobacteraceae bacterium]
MSKASVRAGRFGIKVKLQVAFGVVAIMTVVAAAVAIMSFSDTERGFAQVSTREVPMMTDALRLSVASGEISASAARFVSAKNTDDRKLIAAQIAARSRELDEIMNRLRVGQGGGAGGGFAIAEPMAQKLKQNLKAMEEAISERTTLSEKLDGRLEELHKIHTAISDKLTPIVDDSYFDVVTTAEDVGQSGDVTVRKLVQGGMQVMQALIEVSAETNLVTGLLTSGALTTSPSILALLEDRFTASARRAEKQLKNLPAGAKFDPLREKVRDLIKLANFKGGETGIERLEKVFRAHEQLNNLLIGLIDDLNFDVVMEGDAAVKRTSKMVKDLVAVQITEMRNALELSAQTHLVTSLLSEAAVAKDADYLMPMEGRFNTAIDLLIKASKTVSDTNVKALTDALIAFGHGDDSVFALRRAELEAALRADQTIKENVSIQQSLDGAVSGLVKDAEKSMQSGSTKLLEDLGRNRMVLMIVAAMSLLAAGAIGVLYVQRRLVRRLTAIGDAMRRLSSGETDLAVPAAADSDEIGEMARSLEVFRAGEIERREMATRRESEQAVQRERAAGIEKMIGDFRATVTAVIAAVTDNVARMETTARTLSSIASEADSQARAASASSEQTSSNVRSVAGATEELGSSIREISEQASQANGVVERATEIARNADQLVGQLSTGANRIGDVVKLIRAIAEQTNLLALNATIEAARAGEAGRGFAVVASEVKTLASQTAKATEEISAQIGAIQGSTGQAVEAIRQISGVMGDISRFTSSIAASVEEQSASTQEIGRNVQQAASGANELAGNMSTVTEAIEETNKSATQVLDASGALTTQAGMLQEAVDQFLERVAAA